MKKIALLCFALAGGLQAMEVNEVDLENGEGAEEVEMNTFEEDLISPIEKDTNAKKVYIVVDNEQEASYLHLVKKYGGNAANHTSWWQSPDKALEKANNQIEELKKITGEKREYHWDYFFDSTPDFNPGALVLECDTELSREQVNEVLKKSPVTEKMRTLYFSSPEARLKLAAKAAGMRIKQGYSRGVLVYAGGMGVFVGAGITLFITALVQNWE